MPSYGVNIPNSFTETTNTMHLFLTPRIPVAGSNSVPGTNLNEVYSPELWAMESVMILFENAVSARLVHRDFEPMFASFGDVVNTRKPHEVVANRKAPGDPIVRKAATATNIPVKLNQHLESSFYLTDEESSKSFKNLVDEFLRPHTIALARMLDQIVLGQHVHYMHNQAGTIGGLTTSNAVSYISNAGLVMTRNKAHMDGRQMIWSPEAESLIVQNRTFHEADKRGDTVGLRAASLGHKLNFDHWMDQNVSLIPSQTQVTGAINNGNITRGSTVLTVDGFTGSQLAPGRWFTINGKVYQSIAETAASNTTSVTLSYGLLEDVADNDPVSNYPTALIDLVAGYAVDYNRGILIDANGSQAPPIVPGQIVSFGIGKNYVVVRAETVTSTETEIWLDRPLEASLADNDVVFYGPGGGSANFGFHRNALTLAVRPLAPPRAGAGAIGGLASFNGLTMRAVVSYDHNAQAHVVTLDFLAGVKVLEPDLGVVVLS